MVEEELLEDIERALESERLRTVPVLLDFRRLHSLHARLADRHRSRLAALRRGHFASSTPKLVTVVVTELSAPVMHRLMHRFWG
jgi:hypothetical protein